jgi:hypothetical protein
MFRLQEPCKRNRLSTTDESKAVPPHKSVSHSAPTPLLSKPGSIHAFTKCKDSGAEKGNNACTHTAHMDMHRAAIRDTKKSTNFVLMIRTVRQTTPN